MFDEPCRGPTAASDTIVADAFAAVVKFGNQRAVSLFVCLFRFRLIQRLPLERVPEPRSGDKPKWHGVKQIQGCSTGCGSVCITIGMNEARIGMNENDRDGAATNSGPCPIRRSPRTSRQSHPSSASELSPLISAMTLGESMAFSV
jgi:hypothetical protein